MKRYILPMVGLIALPLSAQNVVDANRFGSQNITGTARYRSMGGAFGALGGDPSCMTDNPAGMGIYRGTSAISFTPNLSFAHTTTEGSEKSKQKKVDCSVSNLAYVLSIKTPTCDNLVNFNVGVGFNHSEGMSRKYKMVIDEPNSTFGDYLANRANNSAIDLGWTDYERGRLNDPMTYFNNPDALYVYNKDTKYDPWQDPDLPLSAVAGYNSYAIDQVHRTENGTERYYPGIESRDWKNSWASYQRMFVTEMNRNDEYNINFSANWNDFIYAGLTFSVNDFNSTIETEFNEDYDYQYQGDFIQALNDLETKGTGFGIKAGILLKPTDNWRIGFAAHTPTWYHMEDLFSISMLTSDPNCKDYAGSETFSYRYMYYSPWQMQLSSAWVLGGRALLSAEVDMKDYSTQKYRSIEENSWDEKDPNEWMDDVFKDYNKLQLTYKAGGEYRVTDHFSVRAGYAFKGSPYKQELYDNPGASRGWSNGYFGDDNTILFDSNTKPNYSLLGNQQFISAGCGWSGDWWHIDLSFMNRHIQEKIAAYPTTDALLDDGCTMSAKADKGAVKATHCNMKTNTLTWDLTLGMRF